MSQTFSADYYDADGSRFSATIFISPVTLTIRYNDSTGRQIDVHWLGDEIHSLDQLPGQAQLTYRHKDGRSERLVVRDEALLKGIKSNFRHQKFAGSTFHHSVFTGRNKLFLVLLFILGIIFAGYFWFVPWLGERAALRFSKAYEIDLGEKMYQSLLPTLSIDTADTRLLREFYRETAYAVDYPVQVTVVRSEEKNAFAIPGGHIVIYDAILNEMKTAEELAALLAHEASHISLRHSLKNLFRRFARKIFLAILIGNESGIISFLADNADELKELQYSRRLETESDNNGLQLMLKSNIDPNGMLRLMETLQNENSATEPVSFMSTHPVFKERIVNIKKKVRGTAESFTANERLAAIFKQLHQQF